MTDSGRVIVVTGAAGFAGGWLVEALRRDHADIRAWRRAKDEQPTSASADASLSRSDVDMLDAEGVRRAVAAQRPSVVFHCAGAAHVAQAWADAAGTLAANVIGTHNLLEALRRERSPARVLVPGTGFVYRQSDEALTEDHPLGPASPYALSKLAQEQLALRAAVQDGLDVVATRSFNHLGPRQDPSFVSSSFAHQIARIEAGLEAPEIVVGNLEARRDFTDVRDVVRAYQLIVDRGRRGAVYNVCSGRAVAIRELLDRLLSMAQRPIEVRVDPARFRPNDNPVLLGSSARLRDDTGWAPAIPIEQTLADILNYWRDVVRTSDRTSAL